MSFQDVNTRRGRLAAIGLLTALAAVPLAPLCADPLPPSGPPVATGLDNPKGLRFGLDGSLYIAEAGHGGSGACVISAEQQEVCFGATGAITQVKNGVQRRIVTGLPSLAGADGFAATGPHDVSALGNGILFVPIGLGNAPQLPRPVAFCRERAGHADPGERPFRPLDHRGRPGGLRRRERSRRQRTGHQPLRRAGVAGPDFRRRLRRQRDPQSDSWGTSTFAVFADELVPAPDFLGLPPGAQIPMQAVPTAIARGPAATSTSAGSPAFRSRRRRAGGGTHPGGRAGPQHRRLHQRRRPHLRAGRIAVRGGDLPVQPALRGDGRRRLKVDPAAASKDEAELIAEVQAPAALPSARTATST